MVLLIDNYDSFVHNLARYVQELGEDTVVRRNDQLTLEEIVGMKADKIILSPGPCSPVEAGISTEVIRAFGERIPILGVCLGHQCVGVAYGGRITRARRPLHGRTSLIQHDGSGIFTDLPSPLRVARYHSLVIADDSVPAVLRVTARSAEGEIMAVQHREHPVTGVQFHPESAASEYGYTLINHFLHGTQARMSELPIWADGAEQPVRALSHAEPGTREDDIPFQPPPVDLVR